LAGKKAGKVSETKDILRLLLAPKKQRPQEEGHIQPGKLYYEKKEETLLDA
jgi:hypothetical protein